MKTILKANPVVLVTGASRGLGRAIALTLGQSGCKVIVNYAKNEHLAKEVCHEIQQHGQENGSDAIAIKADCSNHEEVQNMFSQSIKHFGPVDILINNAGITKDKLTIKMTPNDFQEVIQTNLNSSFYCSQLAIKSMMKQRSGRIINMASIVGQVGNPGQANYAASKGGMIAMTKTLAKEYGSYGITCNVVCPGFIQSDMTKELVHEEKYIKLIPLQRYGSVEEVAGLVRFLALDPAASYMTGHCFNIDGGFAIGAT